MHFNTNSKSNDVRCFRIFGCPKCGAKHKYGHDRDWQDCHRCAYTFSPAVDSRRYEGDRIMDQPPEPTPEPIKVQPSISWWNKAINWLKGLSF